MNGIQLVRLDATVLIWIEGVLDASRAPALHATLTSVLADGSIRSIVVDMASVYGVDDGGVGVLAAAAAQLGWRRGPIQLLLPRGIRATAGDPASVRLLLEQLYPECS